MQAHALACRYNTFELQFRPKMQWGIKFENIQSSYFHGVGGVWSNAPNKKTVAQNSTRFSLEQSNLFDVLKHEMMSTWKARIIALTQGAHTTQLHLMSSAGWKTSELLLPLLRLSIEHCSCLAFYLIKHSTILDFNVSGSNQKKKCATPSAFW